MTKREVLGRYKGSAIGLAWSFFNPIFMLVVYTFVFSEIFKSRWDGAAEGGGKTQFAVLLFVGMIVHGLFAEILSRAPSLIVNNINYVKKVIFPIEIMPIIAVGATLFHTLISTAVLLVAFIIFNGYLHWTVIFFPLVLLPLVILSTGLAWVLASLGVFLRDVSQFIGILITILMFLSPVFYPISAVPENFRPYIMANPLTFIIEQARAVLIFGQIPDMPGLAIYTVVALGVAGTGYAWFQKQEKGLQMSSDQVAIQISKLSKCYEIYDAPRDRLKQFILPVLQRKTGRSPKRYFREFWALRDVSFDVMKGETIGVIGRNGCGKSTLLQMICGTLSPTEGSIRTQGRIAALLELGSGFNPEFTGRENVYLNAAVLGLTRSEIEARFDAITAFAEIGEFIEQPVKTYSSGMMVRLAFAVIAHVDADILIVDEALAVGDAFFTQKCMRFLRQFMKTGTVLFVSHDTSAIVNLCSRAILLEHGKS